MEFYQLIRLLLAIATAAFITGVSIPVIVSVAWKKGLIDQPKSRRKIHQNGIPTLGGLGIFLGLMIAYPLWVGEFASEHSTYLKAALVILFAAGMKDDLLTLDSKKKALVQLFAALILVLGGGVMIGQADGFLGVSHFPLFFSIAFTVFAFVVIINAYNLIDGVDGLAGSQSLIGSILFGAWFLINGHWGDAFVAAVLAGTMIGFLYHNRYPARIFMGDTGSLVVGLVMATMAFRMITLNNASPVLSFHTPTIFAFSIMIIPMFDTLRVIILRLLNKRSPLKADQRHLHHCLLRLGLGHTATCLVLNLSGLFIVLVSYWVNAWEIHLYLLLIFLLAVSIVPLAWLVVRIRSKDKATAWGHIFNGRNLMNELIRPSLLGREPESSE